MAGTRRRRRRRSNPRSRKGCETCKRRHMRCDENFPQCHNCTSHKFRCPYNDVLVTHSSGPSTPAVIGMVWSDLVLVWSRPPRLGLV
ncbi:hypothetical protein HZS61_008384 [Fusarium oxysporum f. sp. conglutinans]|uniref:Zn(2)-C6 fungal-type domain-containing protein n=1 Tax=Fusarium oxysporum f. sp. conglutinans TaxID=100902 RepID=A0A8H6H2M5_FUSOX|nr:hypothetical protein HZS61_008384 [Fusarium oxysporum f. sp. conglutinans]KAG7001243.1 Sterol uptake control protein 2 [Fusarium oxysporum f. sp. conglutinans]KAI8416777.1 hypothetical protein FOFC_03090 [Fusarium oxysporum]